MPTAADLPRPEYPRPHRIRQRWLNLNGEWQFAFDDGDVGRAEGWHHGRALPQRITVPFTFEAPLSGIGDTAVHPVVWYRREVEIPESFLRRRLLLHVGACDFAATVWVNGRLAGEHRGGYAPLCCEIQHAARPGRNEIVLRAEDRPVWTQPRGKQIVGAAPEMIDYDRVTGIWQTVWLEPVDDAFVDEVWTRFRADGRLTVDIGTNRPFSGEIAVALSLEDEPVSSQRLTLIDKRSCRVDLEVPAPRLWSPQAPVLYDIDIALQPAGMAPGDGDRVRSYAGLRRFGRRGRRLLLNDQPFYFRAVLDQGYFPGGWYTAPSDDDLRRDIERAMAMGFNGARKHQKAEDPRWLYWADRLGFAVWSEMPSGREFGSALVQDLTSEWTEIVRRDRMHPSIMAWVPFNESWGVDRLRLSARQRAWTEALYHLTHACDDTRLVIANDGWEFAAGDVWGVHSYVADAEALGQHLRQVLAEPTTTVAPERPAALPGVEVGDIPVVLTEFGGLAFRQPGHGQPANWWGYAEAASEEALEQWLGALLEAVRGVPELSGFVWTQLTDVQLEINGLLHFDRTPKLPLQTLRRIFAESEGRDRP